MANVLGQHYFTEFWHNRQKVKFLNRPTEYGMTRDGHQAVLTFILPLAHPQPLAGQKYRFSTFDPTYYVDMHYAGTATCSCRKICKNLQNCRAHPETQRRDAELCRFS